MADTRSGCCYCGVIIEPHDGCVTGVGGDSDHPANLGRLCTKGATLHLSARHASRALHPELRRSRATPRSRGTPRRLAARSAGARAVRS